MTFKHSVSPEAANDLASTMGFDNPTRKLHHTTIEKYDIGGREIEVLRLHYELVGFEFGKDYHHYSMIEMPMESVIETLKFAFQTVASAYHLSHADRLP